MFTKFVCVANMYINCDNKIFFILYCYFKANVLNHKNMIYSFNKLCYIMKLSNH